MIWLAFLFMSSSISSFSPYMPNTKRYEVRVAEGSEMVIEGQTNINKFNCTYNDNLMRDPLVVEAHGTAKGLYLKNAELDIAVNNFDCLIPMMTRDMKELLQHEENPYIKVKVDHLTMDNEIIMAKTQIYIAGINRHYQFPLLTDDSHHKWTFCTGFKYINIRDYNLKPPVKLLGAVRVKEHIGIRFNLKLSIKPKSS